ncbi:hypothetical protein [Geobacter anodireducens]
MKVTSLVLMAAMVLFFGIASATHADTSLYAIMQRTQHDDVGRAGIGLEVSAPVGITTLRALGEIGSQVSNDPALDYRVEAHVAPTLPQVPYFGIGAEQYSAQSFFDPDIHTEYVVAGYRVRGKLFFLDAALRYQVADNALAPALEGGLEFNRRYTSFRYEHITPGLDLYSLRFGVRF